jgi:hypothetical protein
VTLCPKTNIHPYFNQQLNNSYLTISIFSFLSSSHTILLFSSIPTICIYLQHPFHLSLSLLITPLYSITPLHSTSHLYLTHNITHYHSLLDLFIYIPYLDTMPQTLSPKQYSLFYQLKLQPSHCAFNLTFRHLFLFLFPFTHTFWCLLSSPDLLHVTFSSTESISHLPS